MKITHPYENLNGGSWLRGNLHTHTTNSDGTHDMQNVINTYANLGYDFLSISDHDIFTGLTEYEKIDNKGLVLIPGNEISKDGPHLLHVDGDRLIEPHVNRQLVFDEVKATQGFVVVAHPNLTPNFNFCSIEVLEQWTDYAGLEIFNTIVRRLAGSPYATNKWYMLLSQGRRLWGFANDDAHFWREENRQPGSSDTGVGWNVVYADSSTPEDIVTSLQNGRFYCSTGVVIKTIKVEGLEIIIECENASRIVGITRNGQRVALSDNGSIKVDVSKDENWPPMSGYLRFECWGEGEKNAWTQPFFLDE